MPDGGRALPHDPIGAEAHICKAEVQAMPGWALGEPAARADDVWHLPPDMISPDPSRSRIEADVGMPSFEVHRDKAEYRIPLRPFGVDDVPQGIDLFAAGTETFAEPSLTDPPFTGAYWLDGGRRPGGSVGAPRASVLVRMNGITHDGMIWLVTELKAIQAQRYLSLTFQQRKGDAIVRTPDSVVPLAGRRGRDMRVAVLFKAPIAFDRFRIDYVLDCRVGILGIGGVSQAALDWTAAHNQQRADEAAALAAVNDAGPQLDPVTAEGLRTILQPGALYRLDVGMSWGASMVQPDGATKTVDGQSDFAPRGGGDTATSRRYYFRTFPLAAPAPAHGLAVFDGRWRALPPADPFHPELLERHLIGYTPAQAEQNWFRNDPLEAHFGVRHVPALANVYGYDVTVGLRRVDVPGDAGVLRIIVPAFGTVKRPLLLRNAADRYRHEVAEASPCVLPTPGMSASVTDDLAPRAWYEVHVALPSKRAGIPDSRLPGVTFRTSRYHDVDELAQAIGFGFTQGGYRSGDVALAVDPATLPAATVLGDDLAFDEILAVLGMEGWPPSAEPRTSLLWGRTTEGWRLGGVLIECPEPIHRPGRCEVSGLSLEMGSAAAAAFDIVHRDRSGSRLLYLTRTPFVPQRWRKSFRPIERIYTGGQTGARQLRDLPGAPTIPSSISGLVDKDKSIGIGRLIEKAHLGTSGGSGGLGPMRLFRDPTLDLSINDFAHDPMARTGRLILPMKPSFAEERA